MRSKTFNIAIITCLFTAAMSFQVSANSDADNTATDSVLQVYLPRKVTVTDSAITLEQVSIIRGSESLTAKAGKIALGTISAPGQEIIINKTMILSRLACNGFPKSKIKLSGAEKVTVTQQQQIIKGDEFVKLASSFLEKNRLCDPACQWKPIRTPKDLVIPAVAKDVKLSPRLAKSAAKNQVKVQITASNDGKELGACEVNYQLKYNYRRAVTLVELQAGTVISPENVNIEQILSNHPEPADWLAPYGLVARYRLPAKTAIRPNMVCPARPRLILERNKTVIIRLERPGLLVTAVGKTMQRGRTGEYIKVRNIDSQRVIMAKVNEDGTVEPAL